MTDDPIEIPIEDTLDLHPFRPNEIRDVVLEYLTVARERGLRQVRLIHGRGIGVQRASTFHNDVEYREDPVFGFEVPLEVPGVDSSLLDPRSTWRDREA